VNTNRRPTISLIWIDIQHPRIGQGIVVRDDNSHNVGKADWLSKLIHTRTSSNINAFHRTQVIDNTIPTRQCIIYLPSTVGLVHIEAIGQLANV
jgi:hypothetical protein